jgi:hypothetical protein
MLTENSKCQTAPNDKNFIKDGVDQYAAAVEKDGSNVNVLDHISTNKITSSHLKSS